jgi:hypothetical protein
VTAAHTRKGSHAGDPHEAFRQYEEKAQHEPDVEIRQGRQTQQQQGRGENRPDHHRNGAVPRHESRHERRRREHRQVLDSGVETDHGGADTLPLQHQGQQRQAESVHQRGNAEHGAHRHQVAHTPAATRQHRPPPAQNEARRMINASRQRWQPAAESTIMDHRWPTIDATPETP